MGVCVNVFEDVHRHQVADALGMELLGYEPPDMDAKNRTMTRTVVQQHQTLLIVEPSANANLVLSLLIRVDNSLLLFCLSDCLLTDMV